MPFEFFTRSQLFQLLACVLHLLQLELLEVDAAGAWSGLTGGGSLGVHIEFLNTLVSAYAASVEQSD